MAQDTTPAIVCYQGDGSNSVFSVPFDKGYYGEVRVLFVRRGLADYTYYPDTYTVSGRLYAWALGPNYIYTHTPNPAVGAHTYNSEDVEQANDVTATAGQTITVNSLIYSRAVQHDLVNNLLLTWTGDTLEIGDFICIIRDTERGQPYTMPNNQKHIENALDNLERQIQEVKDATDNALKVDPSYDIEDSHKMNPIEWLETIIRSTDKSVRALRYANDWLDYSLDDPNIADEDKTWNHLLNTENIKSIREQSYIVDGVTYYRTQYMASDGTWKTLADPSKWDNMKLTDLADTNITSPVNGQFIMFDGLKWKNVYSSATASWGTILGDINDQTDLMNTFVKKTGDTLSGMYKHEYGSRTRYMSANNPNTYADVIMNGDVFQLYYHYANSVTATLSMRAYNNATMAIYPDADNYSLLGLPARRFAKVYTAQICADTTGHSFLTVPTPTDPDTLALVNADIGPLQQQINHLQTIGRFLSFWDATTGLAQTNPQTSPYIYQTGDYFRVGVVASGGGTNYKPTGSSYITGVASTVVETEPLTVGQVYYYDGTNWALAAGGSVAIDETTIVFNSDNEIQAVATVNQNTAAGATNPVYDWVGTLAEYNAQNIETLHPDWICYITDDMSAGVNVYTKTEVNNNFVGKGHEVIEFQIPTADNNHTWYRKYADGWVEQGGRVKLNGTISATNKRVTFPVEMATSKYIARVDNNANVGAVAYVGWESTMGMSVGLSSGSSTGETTWEVKGMAA